jgi:inner membrane protein YhjD
LAVAKKFGDDRAGYLAALVSYFAFFSLFPLLMALTSVLGLVLEGHDEWKEELTGEATAQIPVVGDQLSAGELTGSTVAIVVGVAVALWSGLKVIDAAQNALNDVWDVPMVGRPRFAKRRIRSVALLGVVGLSLIASLAASSVASFLPELPGVGRFGVYAVTLLFNVGVFLLAFQLLSELDHRWGELLAGSVVAAVGWFIIQAPGAFYIQRTIDNSRGTYREFATVIGLLTFFFLASQVVIVGAEVNVVRARRLWPRSLLARYGTLTDADRQVLADSADATRRVPDQRVQVAFGPPPDDAG